MAAIPAEAGPADTPSAPLLAWAAAAPDRAIACRLIAPQGAVQDLAAHAATTALPAAGLRHLPLAMAWARERGTGPVPRIPAVRADSLPRYPGIHASTALPGDVMLDDATLAGLALISDDLPAAGALHDRLGRPAVNRVLLACGCSTRAHFPAPADTAGAPRLTAGDAAALMAALMSDPVYTVLRSRVLSNAPAPPGRGGAPRDGLCLGRPPFTTPGPMAFAGCLRLPEGVLVCGALDGRADSSRAAWDTLCDALEATVSEL